VVEPETGHLQVATQQVVEEERSQVAHVRVVPYSRPACVHSDLARFLGLEDVLRAGQRVVQPERHEGVSLGGVDKGDSLGCDPGAAAERTNLLWRGRLDTH